MSIVKKKRGFAALDPEMQRRIASMGGKAQPAAKRSFSMNRRLAAEAGSKGGKAVAAAKRSFSVDPELARRAGQQGGKAVDPQKRTFSTDRAFASECGKRRHGVPLDVEAVVLTDETPPDKH